MKKVILLLVMLVVLGFPNVAQATSCETPPPQAISVCDIDTGRWITPSAILAQAPAPKPEADKTDSNILKDVGDKLSEHGEHLAETEESSEAGDLISDATKVYGDWKTGGWMAGLLALVSLLMGLLRFGPVNDFFRSNQIMWLKPILAAVFGGIGGGFAATVEGAGVGPAIVAGLLAGLGAVGLYEVAKRRKSENRTK